MVCFKSLFFVKLLLFLLRILPPQQKGLQIINSSTAPIKTYSHFKLHCHSFRPKTTTLILKVEATLLKSSSYFPYFMLVAFEAGSVIRALILLILYPFLCLITNELSIYIMVFVCFLGIKKESFRVGTSVLPKFFLEDASVEVFEALQMFEKKVGVSELPQVMVECFFRDYLEIDLVVGRDLKVVWGYYVGLFEDKRKSTNDHHLEDRLFEDAKTSKNVIIGLGHLNSTVQDKWFSCCKEIYMVSEEEKLNWSILPRRKYPKPLIFHDGRLAFKPTPLAMLAMFTWFPFASFISIFRSVIGLSLPFNISIPILAFTGMKLKISKPNHLYARNDIETKGLLYVCNHRTLLDPLFLSFVLKKPIAAVTYSLSRYSEILSPITTVRLTRNRDQDSKMMEKLLDQGDLIVCPEGTTCREPYLLRFSPLFTELSDDIVPLGIDSHVTMFHGTTAGGLKCLDPYFFLMNPYPSYTIRFLSSVCGASSCEDGKRSRFDIANHVQSEIGKALGFECTMLTRKDKYLSLAGHDGVVSA